jgi:hypothetical protein
MRISHYERQLIADALGSAEPTFLPGAALVLVADTLESREVCNGAIWPALAVSGYRPTPGGPLFDSQSPLSDVARHLRTTELLLADVTRQNPDVMYVVGLAHGLGRYPLLISQDADQLPFCLQSIRCIRYDHTPQGLWQLREQLTRATRTFLSAAAASEPPDS